MSKTRDHRNVFILATCQMLNGSGRTLIAATSPLIALGIAPNPVLATLPITLMILGTAFTTLPASFLMRRIGRRWGFVIGGLLGAVGGVISVGGLLVSSFWLFSIGNMFFGIYAAFSHYYRFAATDVAPNHFKGTAISLVLVGGVAGAFLGPELAKAGVDLFTAIKFIGTYIFLIVVTLMSSLVVLAVDIPSLTPAETDNSGRPLSEILRTPTFIVAATVATISQAVMNFLMTATPLAMYHVGHLFGDTAFVIEWHSFAMFAPGFFTGSLIKRFGTILMIFTGLAIQLLAIGVALSGDSIILFWASLFLVGLGWNFAFISATTLLTDVHTPSERAKVQGINNFIIFGFVAFSSLMSGTIHHFFGWHWVNLVIIPLILIAIATTMWFIVTQRKNLTQ
ncbi:MAG: MFS transporter [Rhodospirillales bacterium]|jgi:MFS family permease